MQKNRELHDKNKAFKALLKYSRVATMIASILYLKALILGNIY